MRSVTEVTPLSRLRLAALFDLEPSNGPGRPVSG